MTERPFPNLLDPDTYVNGMPYTELARMRRDGGPVVQMEDPITGVPYWAILGRDEIDVISKDPKRFSSWERQRRMFINMDPPVQMKYRSIVVSAFTPRAVDGYAPRFRAHARRIVDAVAGRGECEFVQEVAAELPLLAILELLGIPPEERHQFFDWTNTMVFAQDPDMAENPDLEIGPESAAIAAANMMAYAVKLAAREREQPRSQIVQKLLKAEIDGESLTDDEFGWFFILMISGGNESTRSVTAHGMRLLMENPEQLEYLVANPHKIKAATEEMLRYNTAFSTMRRTCMADAEVGGQQIRAGDKVVMFYHSANHDERVFGDDALAFDVRRAERMPDLASQHRAFGVGQHFCIGSHLARLELQVMFEEIIPRLRNPRFAGEVRYVRSVLANSIKSMPIAFKPER
jgi:cytochrome P450